MKKILSTILCIAIMSSFAACGSKDATNNQELSYNKKEIITTAKNYIKDKYGFEPKILNTKNLMKTDTIPANDILVEMEYKDKKFTTVVANEVSNGKCFDSYQQEEIQDALIGYFDNNIDYDADIEVSYGYMPYELDKKYMVHKKFENPDSLFDVLKENEVYFSTKVLIKLNEDENVIYDLTTLNLTKFRDELTEYNGIFNIINFRNKEDFEKISHTNVFFDGFSDSIMLGLYASESIRSGYYPEYEDYTLVDTGDFLLSYQGYGTTNVIEDFTLEDIEEFDTESYPKIEQVSNAINLHLNNTHPNEWRRVTMYAKLQKPEKLVLSNGDDSLYEFNYQFSSTDGISFSRNKPDLIGDYYVLTSLVDTADHMFFITKKYN